MKTEVYSWRVDEDLKRALEQEATRRGASVASLLDEAARALLRERRVEDDAEQARIQAAALEVIGKVRGGGPDRASRASALVKEQLAARRGR